VDFSRKAYYKVDFGHAKFLDAIFLGQFLLLSTTVLIEVVANPVIDWCDFCKQSAS